jgi:hypothetical protein
MDATQALQPPTSTTGLGQNRNNYPTLVPDYKGINPTGPVNKQADLPTDLPGDHGKFSGNFRTNDQIRGHAAIGQPFKPPQLVGLQTHGFAGNFCDDFTPEN